MFWGDDHACDDFALLPENKKMSALIHSKKIATKSSVKTLLVIRIEQPPRCTRTIILVPFGVSIPAALWSATTLDTTGACYCVGRCWHDNSD